MATRCTCCHICHTSVKTSRRTFYPCSSCPSIICRQCIDNIGEGWDSLPKQWECPRCRSCCPCKRCKNKGLKTQSPKRKEREEEKDIIPTPKRRKTENEPAEITLDDFRVENRSPVDVLQEKNEQCLQYIDRTERLLGIIKEEQNRISSQIESLTQSLVV